MNELRILLSLAVLVISVISVISYLAGTRKKKQTEQIIKSALTPQRGLTQQEADALNSFYSIQTRADMPVFRLEGAYTLDGLEVNHAATVEHHWLGGVRVHFMSAWQKYIEEHNTADVVFQTVRGKETGYLLNLNGKLDICESVDVLNKLKKGEGTIIGREKVELLGNRPVTDNEARYLKPDLRIAGPLMTATALWLVFLSGGSTALIGPALALFIAGLWFFYKPKHYKEKTAAIFRGHLKPGIDLKPEQASINTIFQLGNVTLTPPAHWIDYIPSDKEQRVEAVMDASSGAMPVGKIISAGETLSIEDEVNRFALRSPIGHAIVSVLLALSLLIFTATTDDLGLKLAMAKKALMQETVIRSYSSIQDMVTDPPARGDEIKLSGVTLSPVYAAAEVSYIDKDRIDHDAVFKTMVMGTSHGASALDLGEDKEAAQKVILLKQEIESHLKGFSRVIFLVEQEQLVTALKDIGKTLPKGIDTTSLVSRISGLTNDMSDVSDGNVLMKHLIAAALEKNGEKTTISVSKSDARGIFRDLQGILNQVERKTNSRLAEDLAQRSRQMLGKQVVFVDQYKYGRRPDVPRLSLPPAEHLSKEGIDKSFADLDKILSAGGLSVSTDLQAMVTGFELEEKENYRLTITDQYTYKDKNRFFYAVSAIVACALLLVWHLALFLRGFTGNRHRLNQLRHNYGSIKTN